jgi:hypothetical protein
VLSLLKLSLFEFLNFIFFVQYGRAAVLGGGGRGEPSVAL